MLGVVVITVNFRSSNASFFTIIYSGSLLLPIATQVGSGFDVSAAVYGTHTYTRFSPSELADALSAGDAASADGSSGFSASPTPIERITACVQARGGWDAERSQLRLPPCFRLLMGDVCGGSSTPSMVRKVRHTCTIQPMMICAEVATFSSLVVSYVVVDGRDKT